MVLSSAGESECRFTETPVLLGHEASHLGNLGNTVKSTINSNLTESEKKTKMHTLTYSHN